MVLDQGHSYMEPAARWGGVGAAALNAAASVGPPRCHPAGQAITPDQQRIREFEARIERLERDKAIFKRGYCAIDVRMDRTHKVINQIVEVSYSNGSATFFDVSRSCLYACRAHAQHIDAERIALCSRVHNLFVDSRSISGMLREESTGIGRFKVCRLMEELKIDLQTAWPTFLHACHGGTGRYPEPSQSAVYGHAPIWFGVATSLNFLAQGHWHYLAMVLDLFTRRVVGWALYEGLAPAVAEEKLKPVSGIG